MKCQNAEKWILLQDSGEMPKQHESALAAHLHDEHLVDEHRGGGVAVERSGRAVVLDEMRAPDLAALLEVEREQLAARPEAEDAVARQQRRRDRCAMGRRRQCRYHGKLHVHGLAGFRQRDRIAPPEAYRQPAGRHPL